jgi:hypothetical protein
MLELSQQQRLLWLRSVLIITVVLFPVMVQAHPADTEFTYAGGTEHLQYHCAGQLEVALSSMTFRCPAGAITIPFDSITHMEYRPKVSPAVSKMKLHWTEKPAGSGGKKNRFFTVLFRKDQRVHALVLQVAPDEMRPYLAVLELHSGKRIIVWDYRGFD